MPQNQSTFVLLVLSTAMPACASLCCSSINDRYSVVREVVNNISNLQETSNPRSCNPFSLAGNQVAASRTGSGAVLVV